ncbi:phosphoesterase, partial [Streptococcus thermophilus]|nr:phosphoesterase [Streptococcus thermophilus]
MTRLAVMSDLHIDLNHFETYEIDTLIKCLKD